MNVCQVFSHQFNAKDVAHQEYELAKLHYWEVTHLLDWTQPEAPDRFQAAHERLQEARSRYFEFL